MHEMLADLRQLNVYIDRGKQKFHLHYFSVNGVESRE